jgi:hypothetical protein
MIDLHYAPTPNGRKIPIVRRSSPSEGGSNPFFLFAVTWIASLRSQ